ncbi:stage II sporulation protein P [Paenibacillus antri]|uniref:Stage II sporulation protein P n=1 Tax=Paenibacillus antri TaxID=2582848 RepID=A0A5R9G2D0_9BACL|nr:stage II sporulation protein P [Paenibacillus antri]TLS50512.1 stage II sporulation protein P [Paenibacillus antri]
MRFRQALEWTRDALGGLARALGTVIAWCVIGSFVAVTAVSILWKLDAPPIQGLDGAAAALPSRFYADMLSFEIANLSEGPGDSSFSTKNVASFLTKLTTGIDPADPRTLAAQLLPGAQGEGNIILIQGIGTGPADYPVEVPPAPHLQEPAEVPLPDGYPSTGEEPPESTPQQPAEEPAPGEQPGGEPETDPAPPAAAPNVVFVYHSHPSESYLPELDGITKIDEAYDQNDKNVTVAAVGARLSEELEKKGVGAIHSDLSYPWRGAYDESRKTIKTAMAKYEDLNYFIDIHRDAARKDKTLLTHNGVAYAKLYFVVGQKNPNYEENQALAEELHYRIEEKIKGISRGVVGKKAGSNGEFNQSLSPNSILIEFGGVDNTLEECYRTAEVLAEVLAEMHWERTEAVKANAAPSEAGDAAAPAGPEGGAKTQ